MLNLTAQSLSSIELNLMFSPNRIYIDRYMTLIWLLIGYIGNIFSFIIWIEPKMRRENSSAIYLAALSLNDFLVLVFVMIQDLQYSWNKNVLRYSFCSIYMVLSTCSQLFSPVLVLAFTIERWVAICYPFKRQSLCTPKRAIIVSFTLYLFVLCYNIYNGFMWIYNERFDSCVFNQLETNGTDFQKQYIFATEIVFSGCVPLLILGFNILVIKEMYRITKCNRTKSMGNCPQFHDPNQRFNNERSFLFTTIMLLAVSFYLFFTTLPGGIMFALQQVITMPDENMNLSKIPSDPKWQFYFRVSIIKAVIDELCISHYALNFVIYLITGKAFRKQFIDKIRKIITKFKLTDNFFSNELVSLNKTNRMELTRENSLDFCHLNDANNSRRNRLTAKVI